VKFSVKSKDILYLESTDNYVTVYFSNEGKVSKHMIRTSLKNIENAELSVKLLRCHRSFIVNLENVLWMKKEGRNFVLKIKNIESFIPVSRSYIPQFKSLLQS
jgi:DNA-binding LytR/AlgR family response regulator